MTVSYRTLAGEMMTFTYGGARRLNGREIDLAKTRLYDGPFMTSEVGSGVIELHYGGQNRVLDFRKGSRQ
jgi:hypothetical protein